MLAKVGTTAVTVFQAKSSNESSSGDFSKPPSGGFFSRAPSMGALLRVQVPSQVDHDERSEAQLHEGDRVWEGSVEHKL